MKKLKTDLSTKIHLLHEFEFNSKREKDSIQLEVTQTQAEAERQVWEAKQAAAVECATMTKTIEALNRELELKAGQLNEADDRVQELESELSGFDARIAELGSRLQEKDRELEGARERASECRSSQENAESRLVTLQNLSEELRQKLERSEKQGEDLKTMMGDYEVELNESRDAKEALAQTRALLDQERAKVDQLESERDSARSEVQKFANDVEELSRTLRHERAALAELRQSLEGEREQARLERGKVIQEAKDSESALRSQLQEAQERKLEEAERRHDQEVETLEKKWGLVVEETNANNRYLRCCVLLAVEIISGCKKQISLKISMFETSSKNTFSHSWRKLRTTQQCFPAIVFCFALVLLQVCADPVVFKKLQNVVSFPADCTSIFDVYFHNCGKGSNIWGRQVRCQS